MAGSEKLVTLTADKVEFLKRCAIKSIPVVAAIIEKKNAGRRKSVDAKKKSKSNKKEEKPEVVEPPSKKTSSRARKKKDLSPPPPPQPTPKSSSKKKPVVEKVAPPAIPSSSSSSSDSDSEDLKEKEKEKETLKRKLKEKEDEKRRKREKKEKRRKIEDSDEDNFKIVIESATDSEKEEDKPVNLKKKQPEKPKIPTTPKSSSNKKVKNVGNKDRKQTLLEFNCLTAPQLEIKEINEFLEMRDMLKEYGISKEYRAGLENFPEEQLLTCDSDACPFLLQYERPFSALYEDARRKWTPILESPSGVHIKNKCVTCDKKLTTAPYETWRKFLGATSFYCSIKCISTKVSTVLKDARDAETITVMNLLTGETVRSGIYTREIRSFCLLAPNWMPLSVDVTTSSSSAAQNHQIEEVPKKVVPEKEKVEKKQATISQKIPKKSADQNETLRNSTRQSFENSMFEKSERYRIRLDRREIRDMAMVIEDRLFEKCDKNISHPNYRIWKQQFLQNFEQEKAKNFVFNVLKSRISIEKLVAFDAAQLRNPACWQVRQQTSAPNRKSESRGPNPSRVGVSPLDAIIGDDNRDTTAEHLSHAFSKNCRVCQSKQLADAQEKLKKENEERDLRDRREKNRTMMEEMRKEEMKRKQERKEQKEKEKEAEINGNRKSNGRRNSYDNDYFDDDYGGGGGHTPAFDEPDFASTSFRTHRSSVEPSSSRASENDDWKLSFNLRCGESILRTEATPIFNHIEQNLALMKLCKDVVHRKRLDFHSPLRMQEFLIDSHTAMNTHKTCSIAVLRMMPSDSNDRTFKEILGFNMEKEMVGQLQVDDDADFSELLSVFLFPHKGSEIVHDTLAPLKYTVGTSDDCFLMLFIIKPEFAARFKYSCRMSDVEMREQINALERERMSERSWRQPEPGPNQSWRREAPRTPQDLDLRPSESHTPVQNSAPTPIPAQNSVSEEVETISQTKTKIILNIIANTERIKDIVDSTKDFMHDSDVSEADKSKVKNVIEQRISEEKRKKKEEKLSKDGTRKSLEEFTVPPPQPPVFLNTSIPPPMVPAPVLHPTQQQTAPPLSNTAIFAAAQKPPTQHPFGFPPPAGFSQPPPSLPPGVTAPPKMAMTLPPGVTDPKDQMVDSRSDEQIVADAIRKGQVAPIPEALLLSGPRSSTQPSQITELMEREKRRLMNQHQQRFTEVLPQRRQPPPQNNWGPPEERYRRPREERENWQRELSPPQAQRYRTPSPPQRLEKEVGGSQKKKKEEKNTDDLFPLRFGRGPKKRAIIPDPIIPRDESTGPKKRSKRSRGGKKHKENEKVNGQTDVKDKEENPPPPPPPESDSETSDSPSPPPPPTNIVKPPIFEVNKPPAPPPLSTAPPSNVPLPVPPPPPPTTTPKIVPPPPAAIATTSKTAQFSPAILLPPPPPPPSDQVLKAPPPPPSNHHNHQPNFHHYNPPPPNSNYSRQNYPPMDDTEWTSSPQNQQHNNHQQQGNYSNYNGGGMGGTPRGPPLPPQNWRGGGQPNGPSPRGMYRGGGGNMGGGGRGRGGPGGPPPPSNFFGDSPRNHQMPRGNWRGRGRGNYW